MKKNSLIICALILVSAFARAQSDKKTSIGLTGDFAIPGADVYGYTNGYGISAKLELSITPKLKFAIIPGYFTLASTNRDYYSYANAAETAFNPPRPNVVYKFIPLKVGLRYFYAHNLYIESEAGEVLKASSITENAFLSTIGAGGIISINEENFFDFGFHFEKGYRNNDYYDGVGSQWDFRAGFLHSF